MELTITDSNENFDTWLNKSFVSNELKELVSEASILIVPFENLRDTTNPLLFPVGTDDILRYFKERISESQTVDILITDDQYQEFAFFSDYRRLGNFIIKEAAIPIFVSIFASFVYDKYIKEDESKPQIHIVDKSTHISVDNSVHNKSIHISELADKKYLEPTHIKFSVTIDKKNGTSKEISYEGPASNIDSVLKSLKEYEK